WSSLLPLAELTLNCRTATSIGLSPFFLAHGYQPSPFELTENELRLSTDRCRSPVKQGEAIARTIKESLDWAQAALSYAQQRMEQHANRIRSPSPQYKQGDKVWLNLRNIKTQRPCKK